jgi:hypothetical protein
MKITDSSGREESQDPCRKSLPLMAAERRAQPPAQ